MGLIDWIVDSVCSHGIPLGAHHHILLCVFLVPRTRLHIRPHTDLHSVQENRLQFHRLHHRNILQVHLHHIHMKNGHLHSLLDHSCRYIFGVEKENHILMRFGIFP